MIIGKRLLQQLRWGFCVIAALAIVLIGYSLPRITFENDILALFPQEHHNPGVTRANALIAERVTSKVFFLLSADDFSAVRQSVPQFAQTLNQCECFSSVTFTPDGSAIAQLYQHYAGFTPVLLGAHQRQQLEAGQGARLAQQATRKILTNPGGGLAHQLQQDPFLTLNAFLQQLRPAPANLRIDETGLLSFEHDSKHYVLVYGELSGSPYSLVIQQQARAAIAAAEDQFATLSGHEIIKAGALFYTLAGTAQAQQEISTVGLGSILGILLLLILVFRSPLLLLLAFVPVAFGVLLGLVACYWIFGSVHVIALVFGASLVGVAIDYALHFFTHRHAAAKQWSPTSGMQYLLPALTLGLLSSVMAYLSFMLAGFPGFSQIAVFSAVGLISAYGVVIGLYPRWLQKPAKQALPRILEHSALGYYGWISKRLQRVSPVMLLVIVLLTGAGLWQLQASDDVRRMQVIDPQLSLMEKRFQAIVGQQTALQYVLVSAQDSETLLQRLEALHAELQQLQQAGDINGFSSLANYLPSQARQRANQQLWREQLINTGQLTGLLEQLGVVPEVRAQLMQRFSGSATQFLSLDDLATPLATLPDGPVFFREQQQLYAVVLLQGVSNVHSVQTRIQDSPSALWVDAVAQTNQLLRDYRQGTIALLASAYLLLGLFLSLRYRWRGALATIAPPLLATLGTLALLGWLGQPISVFNLMALLLVLGIGLDGAIFMRESDGHHSAALLAISLSTVTTILAFGLLSLSATAAIQSFGLTILLGIFFCFVLCPLAAKKSQPGVERQPGIERDKSLS